MTEQNHSNGEAQRTAKHENRQMKAKIVSWLRRRTRMEILAFGLMALSGILFAVVGLLYNNHKKPMILLFGVGFLLVDAAVCVFWIDKVRGDDFKLPQTVQTQEPVAATSPSEPLPKPNEQSNMSSETAEPQTSPETFPIMKPPDMALPPSPPSQGVDSVPKNKSNDSSNQNASQPLISQSMVNSPNSSQSIGNVTINQGPQPRRLTDDQQATFMNMLRNSPKGNIAISCLENGGPEPCAFARQLMGLLKASGWTVTNFTPMIGFGDPTKTIPEIYLLTQSKENVPVRAIVLQQALMAVGHDAVGFVRPDNEADFLQLTVAPRKP